MRAVSRIEPNWHILRHRVAIAGIVVDGGTRKPLAGAVVGIESMPPVLKRILEMKSMEHGERWETLLERPDRTRSASDGQFHFLDLPDGKYTLRATLPGVAKRYGPGHVEASVSRDKSGRIQIGVLEIAVQPTTVKGKITAASQKSGILMAEVRMKGSGEHTFSDEKGEYVLTAIEPGKRTIQVFAQGFKPAAEQAQLKSAGASQTLNFTLARAAP